MKIYLCYGWGFSSLLLTYMCLHEKFLYFEKFLHSKISVFTIISLKTVLRPKYLVLLLWFTLIYWTGLSGGTNYFYAYYYYYNCKHLWIIYGQRSGYTRMEWIKNVVNYFVFNKDKILIPLNNSSSPFLSQPWSRIDKTEGQNTVWQVKGVTPLSLLGPCGSSKVRT